MTSPQHPQIDASTEKSPAIRALRAAGPGEYLVEVILDGVVSEHRFVVFEESWGELVQSSQSFRDLLDFPYQEVPTCQAVGAFHRAQRYLAQPGAKAKPAEGRRELTLADVQGLSERRSMHFPGGHLYVALVAYIHGMERGQPDLLYGFTEWLAVTRSRSIALGWSGAVLTETFGREERNLLLEGDPDPERNARAIDLLFEALEEFRQLREQGRVREFIAKFEDMMNHRGDYAL